MQISSIRRFLIDRGMMAFYTVFIAGYFLLPMASGHRRLYYLLVFPAVLLLWRELWQFYRSNLLLKLVLAYTAYMMLSLGWTENFSPEQAGWALWNAVNVVSFCCISGYLWLHHPQKVDVLGRRLVWLAGMAALVSIVVWYMSHPFPRTRVQPLGVMHHENKAAAAYGIVLMFCTQYFLSEPVKSRRHLYLLSGLVIFALVVLTQSRTALAGIMAGLLVLLGWRALILVVLGTGLNWLLLLQVKDGYWADRVMTFSFRPGIWQAVIDNMHGYWLFGHGYLVDVKVHAYGKIFDHAHNSYLASLRDGGLLGLGLLLAVLAVALWWALRIYRRNGNRFYLALLLYSVACITMDFDRLLTQPKELWLYFWLPIGLTMAAYPNSIREPRELQHGNA